MGKNFREIFQEISKTSRTPELGGDSPADKTKATRALIQINNDNFYVSVVTLSINHCIKFLKHFI